MAADNIQDQDRSTLIQPTPPAPAPGDFIAHSTQPQEPQDNPQPQGNNDFANCNYRNHDTWTPGRDPVTGRYVLSQAAAAAGRAAGVKHDTRHDRPGAPSGPGEPGRSGQTTQQQHVKRQEPGADTAGDDGTGALLENAGSTAHPTIGIKVVENDVDVSRLTSTPHETAGAIEILPPGAGKPGRTNSTAFGSGQERPNGHRPLRYPKRDTLLATMEQYVTEEDWQRIVETAVMRAAMGDKDSRKWLSDWLMGPVPKEVSVQVAHQINYDLPTRDIRQLPEEGKEGG